MFVMNTRTNIVLAALAAAGIAGLGLGGCAGESVWEQTFVGAPESSAATLAASTPVRPRSIPWERMQKTLTDLEHDAAMSDVHPDDWTAEQKQQAKAKLLRGLQFGGDPARTQVLGRCEFRTTETIRPDAADRAALEHFARKIGATDVAWSSKILGKTEKVENHPVTSNSTGNVWGSHRDRDRWWDDNFTQTTTTWVPMRVPADDTGFVAYFLRGG